MSKIKSELIHELHKAMANQIQGNNKRLFGALATYIESLGGEDQTVKARKDVISDILKQKYNDNNFWLLEVLRLLDGRITLFKNNNVIKEKSDGISTLEVEDRFTNKEL